MEFDVTPVISPNLPDAPRGTCQALTKKGNICGQPVIASGFPFCHAHMRYGGPGIKKHDRYTAAMHVNLQPQYRHQLEDDSPRDLTEEIAMLRAMLSNLHQQLSQQESISPDSLQYIVAATEAIGRSVERQSKINPERVISVTNVMGIISRIIDIIGEHIPREMMDVRQKIVAAITKSCVAELTTQSEVNNYPGTDPTNKTDV